MSLHTEKEGWGAPLRAPLIATALLLVGLLTALVIAGHIYRRTLRPEAEPPRARFPAPQLETIQTPPHQPRADWHQPPPARIGAAMRATVAQGDALWGQK